MIRIITKRQLFLVNYYVFPHELDSLDLIAFCGCIERSARGRFCRKVQRVRARYHRPEFVDHV